MINISNFVNLVNFPFVTCLFIDHEAPVITCPVNQSVHSEFDQSYGTVTWTGATANDNSGQQTTVTCSEESGGHFNIGQTEVICKVWDLSGNQAMCSFTVNVTGK